MQSVSQNLKYTFESHIISQTNSLISRFGCLKKTGLGGAKFTLKMYLKTTDFSPDKLGIEVLNENSKFGVFVKSDIVKSIGGHLQMSRNASEGLGSLWRSPAHDSLEAGVKFKDRFSASLFRKSQAKGFKLKLYSPIGSLTLKNDLSEMERSYQLSLNLKSSAYADRVKIFVKRDQFEWPSLKSLGILLTNQIHFVNYFGVCSELELVENLFIYKVGVSVKGINVLIPVSVREVDGNPFSTVCLYFGCKLLTRLLEQLVKSFRASRSLRRYKNSESLRFNSNLKQHSKEEKIRLSILKAFGVKLDLNVKYFMFNIKDLLILKSASFWRENFDHFGVGKIMNCVVEITNLVNIYNYLCKNPEEYKKQIFKCFPYDTRWEQACIMKVTKLKNNVFDTHFFKVV